MGSLKAITSSSFMKKFLCDRLLHPTRPDPTHIGALQSSPLSATSKAPAPATPSFMISTRDSSNLFAHEAAFAMGQMQDTEAIPALESFLNDLSLHPIVRYETAEALGAIGLESNIPLLQNSLLLDPAPEVQEICESALKRIQELKTVVDGDGMSKTTKITFHIA